MAQAYWNWIQLLFIGTFLVSIAAEEARLPRRLALLLLLRAGDLGPSALLTCLMGVSWLFSMFCSSVAVTLMVTPVALSLLGAAEAQARGEDSDPGADDSASSSSEAAEAAAARVQRLADAALLGIAYASTIGGLATLTGSIPNYVLAGQELVAAQVSWSRWFAFALPVSVLLLLAAYLSLWARYLRGLRLGLTRGALEAEYAELCKEVGMMRGELLFGVFTRDEVLVAAAQISQVVLLMVRPYALSPFLTGSYGQRLVSDASLSLLPALGLFFVPSVVQRGQAVLTWPAVHEKFDIGLLLLIGGGFAISRGFTESGLDLAFSRGVAGAADGWNPLALDFAIIAAVSTAAQLFSAVGTATTVLPVMTSTALDAVRNPLRLLLPATLACSFAFSLPTATPSNVVVLAKSQLLRRPLRARDFALAGLPVNLAAFEGNGLSHTTCLTQAFFKSGE